MTFNDDNKPRAWVGSQGAYVGGRLLGDWFDWDEIPEDSHDWVEAMYTRGLLLKDAPHLSDEHAERLAQIHEELVAMDHENYHGIVEGEPSLLDLAKAADVIRKAESLDLDLEVMRAWRDASGDDPLDEVTATRAEDRFMGEYESAAAWIESWHEDLGDLAEIPEWAQAYIDWERMARDAEMGGEIHVESVGHDEVWIFTMS